APSSHNNSNRHDSSSARGAIRELTTTLPTLAPCLATTAPKVLRCLRPWSLTIVTSSLRSPPLRSAPRVAAPPPRGESCLTPLCPARLYPLVSGRRVPTCSWCPAKRHKWGPRRLPPPH